MTHWIPRPACYDKETTISSCILHGHHRRSSKATHYSKCVMRWPTLPIEHSGRVQGFCTLWKGYSCHTHSSPRTLNVDNRWSKLERMGSSLFASFHRPYARSPFFFILIHVSMHHGYPTQVNLTLEISKDDVYVSRPECLLIINNFDGLVLPLWN